MLEVISAYILSLCPEGFDPFDMFHTLFYLIGVALIMAAMIRLIHKKASQYNHALSSAMALMFMYMLMVLLHRLIPQIVDPVLEKLPLETYKEYSDLFAADLYEAIDLANCTQKRTSEGGPSENSVQKQIDYVKENI